MTTEGITTFSAFIRFLSCMNSLSAEGAHLAISCHTMTTFLFARSPLMFNDVWEITEGISTVTALTGLSLCRSSIVSNKLCPSVERYFTFTESTCFSLMYPVRFHKTWHKGESFPTCVASIGFLFCVCSLMDNEHYLCSHCMCGVSLCVNFLMFNESWFLRIGFSVRTKGVFPIGNHWYAMRKAFWLKALPPSVQP